MAANISGEDAMEFYLNGDAAPGGRFTFVFDSEAKGESETEKSTCVLPCFSGLYSKIKTAFDSINILFRKIIAYIKYV